MGEGFVKGAILGSGYYFVKGFIRSPARARPKKVGRFATGLRVARANVIRVGGVTAAAMGLFSVVEQALYYYCERDGPVNTAIAAAIAGAATKARRGAFSAYCAALGFGTLGFLYHYYLDDTDVPLPSPWNNIMGQSQRCCLPEKRPPPTTWWPDDLYINMGDWFTVGGILGSGFYFVKGFTRPARVRSKGRFMTGLGAARANAIRIGGVTAAAIGLFTFVEQGLYYYHQKEEPINTAIAAAIAGAAAKARRGSFSASCAALGFGALGFIIHYLDEKDELEKERLQQQQQQQTELAKANSI